MTQAGCGLCGAGFSTVDDWQSHMEHAHWYINLLAKEMGGTNKPEQAVSAPDHVQVASNAIESKDLVVANTCSLKPLGGGRRKK